MKSHEEMTIELFEKYQDQLNEIFKYDIVSKVISIFQNNIYVKKEGAESQINEKLDILFIFSSLLVGTIDCDRMEYIVTDRYMITGEKLNFISIFDYISIVLFNNTPTVVFERDALTEIENFLTNRFQQYEQIYFDEESTLIEIALKEYLRLQNWNLDEISTFTEYGILCELSNILNDPEEIKSISYRLAQIILLGNRDHILFKKLTSEDEFNFFMKQIRSIAGDDFNSVWIRTAHKNNCIYNPNKNNLYIRDYNGIVKDITDVSLKITNLSIDYYYVMIDLSSTHCTKKSICENLTSLFNDNPVEIEKKFVSDSNIKYSVIVKKLTSIPGISLIKENILTVNHDQYYTALVNLPKGISMRLRETEDGDSYYVKLPADDGTSITKREELSFPNCSSLEEFIGLVEHFLLLKNYKLPDGLLVTNGVEISTQRIKLLVNVFSSIIEIVYDISEYKYNGNVKNDFMVECELKAGNELALWYLSKFFKNFGFTETNDSKETRAKKMLKITNEN